MDVMSFLDLWGVGLRLLCVCKKAVTILSQSFGNMLKSWRKLNDKRVENVCVLERAKGFEPSTSTLARLRSTPELRPLINLLEGEFINHVSLAIVSNKYSSERC